MMVKAKAEDGRKYTTLFVSVAFRDTLEGLMGKKDGSYENFLRKHLVINGKPFSKIEKGD